MNPYMQRRSEEETGLGSSSPPLSLCKQQLRVPSYTGSAVATVPTM